MKKVPSLALATLVAVFLAVPASARHRNHSHGAGKSSSHVKRLPSKSSKASARSNKGGEVKGLERAEEVQEMNRRADAQRGFTVAPGVEKAEGEHSGKTTMRDGKKGHTPKGKNKNNDQDKDRS